MDEDFEQYLDVDKIVEDARKDVAHLSIKEISDLNRTLEFDFENLQIKFQRRLNAIREENRNPIEDDIDPELARIIQNQQRLASVQLGRALAMVEKAEKSQE